MKYSLTLPVLLLLTISCSPKSSINYLAPKDKDKKVVDGNASDVFDPKVDILFVVDDSGSMEKHQENSARNIELFTSVFLQNSILDFNIGVITTSNNDFYHNCCGRLVGGFRIITKNTPNSDLELKRNLKVGIDGHYEERPFATLSQAVDSQMLAPGGHNEGFIRPEAALIIIFITDTEDQSIGMSAPDLLAQLVALKNHNDRRVSSYGAIVPTADDQNCKREDPEITPNRIEEFLDLSANGKSGGGKGENIVNLCAPDFGQRLAEFALEIVDQVGSIIYLTRRPREGSIRVTYGAVELPEDSETGWYFRSSTNAIYLGKKIDWAGQPAGSRVQVHYEEARATD